MTHPAQDLKVSIVIPTFHRNEGLIKVVTSVLALPDESLKASEIVIVDNSKTGEAFETATQLQSENTYPIHYVSEPNPGVANARNAGLAAANSRLIAFIDDDETALPGWLDNLLNAHEKLSPAVVFGPVKTALPDGVPEDLTPYFTNFFSRKGPQETQLIEESFGCGNTLLDMDRILTCINPEAPVFNKIANESGGEDDYLFAQIKHAQERFAWAHNAEVIEHVPSHRAKLSYTLRRAFGYGQGPTTTCWRHSPKNIPGLIKWTLIGLGQFIVFGAIASIMFMIKHKQRADFLDKAVRGLGKVLWFPPFEVNIYGNAASSKLTTKVKQAQV